MTGDAALRGSVGVPVASLSADGLCRLMPMALVIAPTGHISHVGPTLAKLRPEHPLLGRRFLEVFQMRRPRHVTRFSDLVARDGGALQMQFRDPPTSALKGVGVVLPGQQGMLVNLSLGIGAVAALGAYDLSSADFAATDLTVEMLYLMEANAAVQTELRLLNRRLSDAKSLAEEMAQTDTLTGLRNRRALDIALDRYGNAAEPFALMLMDLDYFKDVNDRLGHGAGDIVLQSVARVLTEETRLRDTVARAGGDEFVVIFHDATEPEVLSRIADRLLERLREPIPYGEHMCRISASIGLAVSTDFAEPDPEAMLECADRALYASKAAGRGRLTVAGSGATGTAA